MRTPIGHDCIYCGNLIDLGDGQCEHGSSVPAELAHTRCCPICATQCDCDGAWENRKRKRPDPATFPPNVDGEVICCFCWEVIWASYWTH